MRDREFCVGCGRCDVRPLTVEISGVQIRADRSRLIALANVDETVELLKKIPDSLQEGAFIAYRNLLTGGYSRQGSPPRPSLLPSSMLPTACRMVPW